MACINENETAEGAAQFLRFPANTYLVNTDNNLLHKQ